MSRPAFLLLLVVGACGHSAVPHPRDAHVSIAQKRYPEATQALLEEGRSHYIDACGGCHSLPLPSSRRAEAWPAVVGNMSARAHLDAPRRRAIEAYLVAVAP